MPNGRNGAVHGPRSSPPVPAPPARFLALADPPVASALPGTRRRGLGKARRRRLGPRLRRQQGAQAGVARGRRAGAGLRHAGLDRQHPIEPHPSGGRRRRRPRAALPPRAGGMDALGRPRLRQGRQHPALPPHGRRDGAGGGGLFNGGEGNLGACARAGAARGRQALRDSGGRLGPPARRARLRAFRRRAGGTGGRRMGSSSTRW